MATLPQDFDGASEGNRLVSSLRVLAASYGTTLPLPEGRQARRLNDGEVKQTAEEIAENATVPQAARRVAEERQDDRQGDARSGGQECGDAEGSGEAIGVARRRQEAGVGRGEGVAPARGSRADADAGRAYRRRRGWPGGRNAGRSDQGSQAFGLPR